jgi:hypothetical protein
MQGAIGAGMMAKIPFNGADILVDGGTMAVSWAL